MAEAGGPGKRRQGGSSVSLKTMQMRQINIRSFINWCELEYQGKIQARYLNSVFPPAMTNKDIRRKGNPTKFWAPATSQLFNTLYSNKGSDHGIIRQTGNLARYR